MSSLNFIHEPYHIWGNTQGHILVSNESTKVLTRHNSVQATINYLFLNGAKDAARALDKHVKETQIPQIPQTPMHHSD